MISVVMPTFNNARFIGSAIESVLAQTVAASEILVIDDGSTDDTAEVVKGYCDRGPIKYYYKQNEGVSIARNYGVKAAKHDWIAFIDSDDVWYENKLYRDIQAIAKYNDIRFIYSKACVIDNEGQCIVQLRNSSRNAIFGTGIPGKSPGGIKYLLRSSFQVPTSSVVARREDLELVGGFDENESDIEDTLVWMKLGGLGPIYFVDDVDVGYRIHEASWNSINSKNILLYSRRCRLYMSLAKYYRGMYLPEIYSAFVLIGLRRLMLNVVPEMKYIKMIYDIVRKSFRVFPGIKYNLSTLASISAYTPFAILNMNRNKKRMRSNEYD